MRQPFWVLSVLCWHVHSCPVPRTVAEAASRGGVLITGPHGLRPLPGGTIAPWTSFVLSPSYSTTLLLSSATTVDGLSSS